MPDPASYIDLLEQSQQLEYLISSPHVTEDEKEDLLMFLESLSGEEIVMEAPKLPKYEPLAMD